VKWLFLLTLLLVAAVGGALGLLVVYRWTTSMQAGVKVGPGQIMIAPPAGTVPRGDTELVVAREVYATRKNPMAPSPQSIERGQKLYVVYCTPCHGGTGKGEGPVTPRFIPPPDLTSAPVQGKSDGHMAYYIGYGGAIMPAYGEALSVSERWDVVNYIRTLAQK
jgi:mono/diheme cytochrome c family protein